MKTQQEERWAHKAARERQPFARLAATPPVCSHHCTNIASYALISCFGDALRENEWKRREGQSHVGRGRKRHSHLLQDRQPVEGTLPNLVAAAAQLSAFTHVELAIGAFSIS